MEVNFGENYKHELLIPHLLQHERIITPQDFQLVRDISAKWEAEKTLTDTDRQIIEQLYCKLVDPGLKISLQFDETCKKFIISYVEGKQPVFQIKMAPADFEKMTADMVRTVKNYNLHAAEEYTKAQNDKEAGEPKEGDILDLGGGLQDLPCAGEPVEAEPEKPESDSQ